MLFVDVFLFNQAGDTEEPLFILTEGVHFFFVSWTVGDVDVFTRCSPGC